MIQELLNRRVPQFVGLYLVGCWGFLEFFDWVVSRYLLSPALIDFAFATLLLLLPTVIVIAWRHGTPGPDEWKRVDAAAIGLNALVAAGVLFALFRGEELGATTTVKLIEDAEGNTVERTVPKAEFRRSVLHYDLENVTGDAELDWLEYGLPAAVRLDLAQDLFVSVVGTEDPSVREWLSERGRPPGSDVPLTLQREAAELRGTDHFLTGAIRRARGDSLDVTTRLYASANGREVASHDYRGADPLELADRISVDLRRDLGVPEGHLEESVDLPAAELITESPDAFRAVTRGQLALLRDNDPTAARRYGQEAVALDSTSAIARLLVASEALFAGRQSDAAAAIAAATRYAYRLPEPVRLSLQIQSEYLIEQDLEAALRTGRYLTEVYPQDVDARQLLAAIRASSGDFEGMIRELRALLAIDSTNVQATRQLASAFARESDYDSAIAYYERLRMRRPGDLQTRLELANTYTSAARFAEARETLEDAAVVAPRDPDVPRQLAELDLRTGEFGRASERLEEVKSLERTVLERRGRANLEEDYFYARGQFARLEDAYRRRTLLEAELGPPIQSVQLISGSEFLTRAYEAGRAGAALAQIDSLRRSVEEPWSLVLSYPAVRNHLGTGDISAAKSDLEEIRRFLRFAGSADFREAFVAWVEGGIARLEDGNCKRAIEAYDRSRELNDDSALTRTSRLSCLVELRRWEDAQEDADWLVARFPGRAIYRLEVARYYAARGDTAAAREHLATVLDAWSEADADYIPAQEARALRDRLEG